MTSRSSQTIAEREQRIANLNEAYLEEKKRADLSYKTLALEMGYLLQDQGYSLRNEAGPGGRERYVIRLHGQQFQVFTHEADLERVAKACQLPIHPLSQASMHGILLIMAQLTTHERLWLAISDIVERAVQRILKTHRQHLTVTAAQPRHDTLHLTFGVPGVTDESQVETHIRTQLRELAQELARDFSSSWVTVTAEVTPWPDGLRSPLKMSDPENVDPLSTAMHKDFVSSLLLADI